jgi:hypothetical protein
MKTVDYRNKSIRNETPRGDFFTMIEGLLHPSIIVYIGDLTTAEVMLSEDEYRDDLITYLGLDGVPKPHVYDLIWKISVVLHMKDIPDLYNDLRQAAKESTDPVYIFEKAIGMEYPNIPILHELDDVSPSNMINISKAIKFNQTNKGAGYYEGNFGPYELSSHHIRNHNEAVSLMINFDDENIGEFNNFYGFFHEGSEYNINDMYMEAMDYYFRGSFTDKRDIALDLVHKGDKFIPPDVVKALYNTDLSIYLHMDGFTINTLMESFKLYSMTYIAGQEKVPNSIDYSWGIPKDDNSFKIETEEESIRYTYGSGPAMQYISIQTVLDEINRGGEYIHIPIVGNDLPFDYWSTDRIFNLFELVETDKRLETRERTDILRTLSSYRQDKDRYDHARMSTLIKIEKDTLLDIFNTFHAAYKLYYSGDEKDNMASILSSSKRLGETLNMQLDNIKGSRLKSMMIGTYVIDNLYTFLRVLSEGLLEPEWGSIDPYNILGDYNNVINDYEALM